MSALERIVTEIPGPRSRALATRLARVEAPGVTYLGEDYPVFWASAEGATVTDVDENVYLDLTSAFGVASMGHTHPSVAATIAAQAETLIHGMGDVHPTEVRTLVLERLAALAPGDLALTYLATGGAEAIEFALKTALLATGRPRVLAFAHGYHGLTTGALDVTGIEKFRAPFAPLLAEHATFVPYPSSETPLDGALATIDRALAADDRIGAILAEPVQGRGGVIVPPEGFLRGLRERCDGRTRLLILDEIYTGFGRTGTMFACEAEHVVPDLLCVGKALGGGAPIGAVIGTERAMRAWPKSAGEALHTATFLGSPLACAAALAALDVLTPALVASVARRGSALATRLRAFRNVPIVTETRGIGFMHAVEFTDGAVANRVVVEGLRRGVVLLQSGPAGTSITIGPPFVIDEAQLERAVHLLEAAVDAVAEMIA